MDTHVQDGVTINPRRQNVKERNIVGALINAFPVDVMARNTIPFTTAHIVTTVKTMIVELFTFRPLYVKLNKRSYQ
jgi:hypothetical protein